MMTTNRTLSAITGEEYGRIRDYLTVKTGLVLREDKREELVALVIERMAQRSPPAGFPAYFSLLQTEGGAGSELRHLVSRLTVGETHFFRNRPQFDALRTRILPELIRRAGEKGRNLRIWSAGCSTGEEPYSIAMLLLEILPDIADWAVTIMATDINVKSLETAREGSFRNWSFREVDDYYRRRFFVEEGRGWRLTPEICRMVTFRYLNLAEDIYPAVATRTDELDLVVCRNVMIYFDVDLSRGITRRFYGCLKDGGYLLVGHTEHSEMVCDRFRRHMLGSAIVYRKETAGGYWEKGIKLRFRGSGKPSPNMVVQAVPKEQKKTGIQRPSDTEETVRFEEAVDHYRHMRLDEATKVFDMILEVNPANERARYMLALIAANCGNIDRAEDEVGIILEKNPLHLEATYLMSLNCGVRGDGDGEISALKKTVYINRGFVLGHFQMGVFYLREGKEELAMRSFVNVLQILQGRDQEDYLGGVDGLTVGRLRKTVLEMMPGPVPEEFRHE